MCGGVKVGNWQLAEVGHSTYYVTKRKEYLSKVRKEMAF